MDVKSCLPDSEAYYILVHNVRLLEKGMVWCYVKDILKSVLQGKKGVARGSVQGIFQTGSMTGIEASKCLGPKDKIGQSEEQRGSRPLRQPQTVLYWWAFRESKTEKLKS